MTNEVYKVELNDYQIAYVEAANKPAARKAALADLKITKLRGTEVMQLIREGHKIIGDNGGEFDPATPLNHDLPLPEPEQDAE